MSNDNGNSACKNVGVGHLTDPAHNDHGQGNGYGHCDPQVTPVPTPPVIEVPPTPPTGDVTPVPIGGSLMLIPILAIAAYVAVCKR